MAEAYDIAISGVMLSPKEYAAIRGVTVQYVRRLCEDKEIDCFEKSGVRGRGGKSYQIPLSGLPEKEIRKYLKKHRMTDILHHKEEVVSLPLSYEELSAQEREELNVKNKILDGWLTFKEEEKRRGIGNEEAMHNYIRIVSLQYDHLSLSARSLYRWEKARRERGEAALVNRRGRHGNHNRLMTEEMFDIFQYYYLDESRKSASLCVKLTKMELSKQGVEALLPSERTFIRWIEKIPLPMVAYYRYGEKACRDKCLPYIHRSYEDLHSNDIWVCDNHTFDIIVAKEEKPLRVYLTAFLDVRSRKMVGHYVTLTPSSDATLYALRRGIERYGVPKRIYADNGREFVTYDIGGRGFRKKSKASECDPDTILERLGIEFKTAMVKNARAKIIERTFLTVKEEFSKLFLAYTGGNVLERPERLKYIAKDMSKLAILEDFESFVECYMEGEYNHRSHHGIGMRGMTPNEAFKKYLTEVTKASKEELNIMLLRSTRLQKVTRSGVKLSFYEKDLYFISEELIIHHQGQKVFVRYNPADLSEVRIYDEEDRFLLVAKQDTEIGYFASKEEIALKMKEQRSYEKVVKAYMKDKHIKATGALDLVMEHARENMSLGEELNPSIIRILRAPDYAFNQLTIQKAVGAEYDVADMEEPDWGLANKRIKEMKRL